MSKREGKKFGRRLNRPIKITQVTNMGWLVEFGCCQMVYEHTDEMLADLDSFIYHPHEWIERYKKETGDTRFWQPIFELPTEEGGDG
jgi:hypothetical protein